MSIFCLTGNFKSREKLIHKIFEAGHEIHCSVTNNVNYIITGIKPNTIKVGRAKDLRIEILDEQQLLEFLSAPKPTKPVTVEIPLEELKRWAQLAGNAINPKVFFLEDNYEGMVNLAREVSLEGMKELNGSIYEVLGGK